MGNSSQEDPLEGSGSRHYGAVEGKEAADTELRKRLNETTTDSRTGLSEPIMTKSRMP